MKKLEMYFSGHGLGIDHYPGSRRLDNGRFRGSRPKKLCPRHGIEKYSAYFNKLNQFVISRTQLNYTNQHVYEKYN